MSTEDVERKIAHLERTVQTLGSQTVVNSEASKSLVRTSEERLHYIRERFDKLDGTVAKAESSNKYWTTTLLSVIFAVAVSVNYMYVEPMVEKQSLIDRRLMDAEAKLNRIIYNDDD